MNTGALLSAIGLSLLVCVIATPLLIPVLRILKFGQEIREEGPSWHAKKSGTPTMGGIAIVISVIVSMIITAFAFGFNIHSVISLLIGSLLFGIVGYIDDYIKVVKKRNLGLTSKQKFIAQLIVSVVVTVYAINMGVINNEIIIPFIKIYKAAVLIKGFLKRICFDIQPALPEIFQVIGKDIENRQRVILLEKTAPFICLTVSGGSFCVGISVP